MKAALTFGGGALVVFGGLSLLSLALFLRTISAQPAGEQWLSVASLLGPALGMSAVCALSFRLGLWKLRARSIARNAFVHGVMSAAIVYVGLVVVALLGVALSQPAYFLVQVLLASLVCMLAAAAFVRSGGGA